MSDELEKVEEAPAVPPADLEPEEEEAE